MKDMLYVLGTVIMVVSFITGACAVAFMHFSNVGDSFLRRQGEQEPEGPGLFGVFFWRRQRDLLEIVARWSFWAFVAGVCLSLGSMLLAR